MFKFLRKPTIKAQLVRGGKNVSVKLINSTPDQTMIMLFLAMKQIAGHMKMAPRELMNKVIDLDKTIVRAQKVEERNNKYNRNK